MAKSAGPRVGKPALPKTSKQAIAKLKPAAARKSGSGTANTGVGVKQKRRGV